jgi:hypothetical protein
MIRQRGGIMTSIKLHLSSGELEARYKAASNPIEKSHFHAVWLLSLGYAIGEVAELLSFSTRWVHQLIKRYNEGGPERLGDQRANNGTEPTILTAAALKALKQRIKSPPDDGGLWAGPKIARWLAHSWPRIRARSAWLGCAHRHRLYDPAAAAAASTDGDGGRPRRAKKSSKKPQRQRSANIPTRRSRSGRPMSTASA